MAMPIINLEQGMPLVDEAMRRLSHNLRMSTLRGERAVKLIHGYGSSGAGGKIKQATHKELRMMKNAGKIKAFVEGENLTPFSENCRQVLDIYPNLSKDKDFARGNPGITIVIL